MARLLIVDNFDSYTYNLVQMLSRLTGTQPDVVTVEQFTREMADAYDAVIVSPGPGHPANEPTFYECLRLFRTYAKPILGVCLGHQGLIVANGGSVENVEPAHGVVEDILHDGTGLFLGVSPSTKMVRYHSLAAHQVPRSLSVIATTSTGLVMSVRHRRRLHFGVQFHPESVLSREGEIIVSNFLMLAGIQTVPAPITSKVVERSPTDVGALTLYPVWIEPEKLARSLLPGRRRAFWLDSAQRGKSTGRYSVLGYLSDDEQSIAVGGPEHARPGVLPVPRGQFMEHLSKLAKDSPAISDDLPAVGGWVGILGYETQEILPSRDIGSPQDGFFMKTNRLVVFDHDTRCLFFGAETAAAAEQLRIEIDVADQSSVEPASPGAVSRHGNPPWRQYSAAYGRIEEALLNGETYEAVLTFPLDLTLEGEPFDHYLALRRRNPAPYCAYLRHDDEVILSASPERMLSVSANGVAEVRPIKGTLPRSADPQTDALARWTLATEDKFFRENLMITDLIRNDLGRVSQPGTIAVTQLMEVESFHGVHQLVSAVSGTLREEISSIDCLRAVFPAGSMTGAPKRRTMELIREVEWGERGLYAGSLGWFDGTRAEFSVVIRTLHGKNGHYRLQVGGGIVMGSTPESEFAEALEKAKSVLD